MAGGRGRVWSLSGDLAALESRIVVVAVNTMRETVRLMQGGAVGEVTVVEVAIEAVRVGKRLC